MKGGRLILKEDYFFYQQYKKGDIFHIIGEDDMRGWDIKHEKTGGEIHECRFIHDKFEKFSIKDERKQKINKINEN